MQQATCNCMMMIYGSFRHRYIVWKTNAFIRSTVWPTDT